MPNTWKPRRGDSQMAHNYFGIQNYLEKNFNLNQEESDQFCEMFGKDNGFKPKEKHYKGALCSFIQNRWEKFAKYSRAKLK